MTVEACMAADRRGRVARAQEKTRKHEHHDCFRAGRGVRVTPLVPLVPAPELPPFAYTDSAAVNQAAVDGVLALTHAIFGDPVDDADLLTKAANPDGARCQKEMLRRANRVESTILREILRAKKIALEEATTDSASALAAELQKVFLEVFVPNQKIVKAQDRLKMRVDEK
jgi:hypothetical protein